MVPFSIATDRPLTDVDERYRAAYAAQRARLVTALEALTDAEWQTQSRNSRWTVQQTMQHVAGVRMENVRVLSGGAPTWSGTFDPHRTPQEDIDTRAGESPAETLQGFDVATGSLLDLLAERSDSEARRPMLWGEHADFRLFFLHVFWDSLVHERDVFVPLGRAHDPGDEALTLATAYGLLIAGVAVHMSGEETEVPLVVDGLGCARLDVSGGHLRVDLDAEGAWEGHEASGAGALIDALAARGDVAAVVDAPADVLERLGRFGVFLRG